MADAGEPMRSALISHDGALRSADFRRMLQAATSWLDQHADAIDAINVFPVPDGDTGRNMAQTLRAAWESAAALPEGVTLGEATRAAADGALLAARGNSGVILSQWLRGLALAVEERAEAGTGLLAEALARASESAYAAIEEPREGTILSVARAAADCGPNPDALTPEAALRGAVTRAQAAVARTPEQIPLLAEAGVVDAGAQGLAVVLAGLHQGLVGVDGEAPAADFGQIRAGWLAGAAALEEAGGGFGFCTEYLISGEALDLETIRRALDRMGDSLVVAGDARHARVHVHTDDPEAAFDAGRRFGTIDRCRTDDMDVRHATLTRRADRAGTVAAVAVASGAGFARLFRELGAEIVEGGATHNPSAAEILAAARRSGGRDVLVLPNDPTVIAAARQAAELAAGMRLHVVATDSQPAAVAALSVWDRAAPVGEARERMSRAAESLLAGAVTRAARAIDRPIALQAGQPFAMLGQEIVAGAETTEDALATLAERILARWEGLERGPAELLSVYTGAEVVEPNGLREQLSARLAALGASVEVEVVIGGQPHYPFLLSLE